MVLLPDPAGPSMAMRRGRCMRPPCFNERRYCLGLYHMLSAPHRVCFDWPAEPRGGTDLSTGVYGCSWFSFGFAVSFAVKFFLLTAHEWVVRASNGKSLKVTLIFCCCNCFVLNNFLGPFVSPTRNREATLVEF